MRIFPILLSVAVLGVGGYLHISGRSAPLERRLVEAFQHAAFAKEIHFTGLEVVSQEDLRGELPLDRSVGWWWWERAEIAARLEAHPLVARARVERCGALSWGCFTIRIEERRPEFVTRVGDKAWLVGVDGAFMGRAPLSAVDPAAPHSGGYAPVVLEGIDFGDASPDVVKARLDVVRGAIKVLEDGTGQKVRAAALVGGSDIEVRFDGVPFPTTFELPRDGDARLRDEAERFKRLYGELGEKHRLVKSIDLAFDRVAVVKFIE